MPRGGLGPDDEHADHLRRLATVLCGGDTEAGARALDSYREVVRRDFDSVLAV